MANFKVSHFNPHHVEPTVYHVEANRMEIIGGSVLFFKEYHSSTPFMAFPANCTVVT